MDNVSLTITCITWLRLCPLTLGMVKKENIKFASSRSILQKINTVRLSLLKAKIHICSQFHNICWYMMCGILHKSSHSNLMGIFLTISSNRWITKRQSLPRSASVHAGTRLNMFSQMRWNHRLGSIPKLSKAFDAELCTNYSCYIVVVCTRMGDVVIYGNWITEVRYFHHTWIRGIQSQVKWLQGPGLLRNFHVKIHVR